MKLRAIPGRLWVALAVLGLLLLPLGWSILFVGASLLNTIPVGVVVACLLTLPRGHPLARQCAFYVAVLLLCGGAVLTPNAIFAPERAVPGVLLLGSGALLAWSLAGQAVLRYFDLYCGGCSSYDTYQRGFLFAKVGCRRCLREWKPGEMLDPSIFE